MDFDAWIQEAEIALREAGALCGEANEIYEKNQKTVETLLVFWARNQFLVTALQSQLQIMGNAYILISHTINSAETTCKRWLRKLNAAESALDRLLEELKNIPMHDDTSRTLYSFVHDNDIANLRTQLSSLEASLKSGVGAITGLPGQAQKEISGLRTSIPKLEQIGVDQVAKDSENATNQIQEMAALLESITKHYDLCCEAKTLHDPEEIAEIGKILEMDRQELKESMDYLRLLFKMLQAYHDTTTATCTVLKGKMQELHGYFYSCDNFTRSKLRIYIDQLESRNFNLKDRFQTVERLVEEVEGLCEYYKLFQTGYEALLEEKTRRDKYKVQLAHLISEINSTMHKHHQKEVSLRHEFISSFGEYLPNDIWDELYDQPPVYTVTETSLPPK